MARNEFYAIKFYFFKLTSFLESDQINEKTFDQDMNRCFFHGDLTTIAGFTIIVIFYRRFIADKQFDLFDLAVCTPLKLWVNYYFLCNGSLTSTESPLLTKRTTIGERKKSSAQSMTLKKCMFRAVYVLEWKMLVKMSSQLCGERISVRREIKPLIIRSVTLLFLCDGSHQSTVRKISKVQQNSYRFCFLSN